MTLIGNRIFGDIISQGHARLGVAPNILCLVSLYEEKTETHRGGGRVMKEAGVNAWAVLLRFTLFTCSGKRSLASVFLKSSWGI